MNIVSQLNLFKYIYILVKLEIKYSTYCWLVWYLPACVIKDESQICSLDLSEKIWAHRAQHLVGRSFSGAHPDLAWAWEWKPPYMCTLDDPFAHPSPGFIVYFSSSSFYSNFVHSIPKLYKAGNQNHKIQVQGSSILCAYWKRSLTLHWGENEKNRVKWQVCG